MKDSKYIDHTLLKAFATEDQILKLCEEASLYDFKSVYQDRCSLYVPESPEVDLKLFLSPSDGVSFDNFDTNRLTIKHRFRNTIYIGTTKKFKCNIINRFSTLTR